MLPLVLLHTSGDTATSWSGFPWPPERPTFAPDSPSVGSVVELLQTLGSPAVLVAHGDAASISTAVHADHPELVAAEIVIEPTYPADAPIARRTKPTLGVFAAEETADVERLAGGADRVVWPGLSRDLHREAPAAFVRTVERWLARL
ncbi:hypothetical protein HQQ81_21340 [Microbacteriaceae bacterium VKM Ac-2854]|nr:hypothetical protein [Microbacteriaceae bacterium VKM Ac-2854]